MIRGAEFQNVNHFVSRIYNIMQRDREIKEDADNIIKAKWMKALLYERTPTR